MNAKSTGGKTGGTESKLKFEGQLDGAGPANLIERVEAAVLATAGTKAVGEGLRRAAKQGAGQAVHRRAETGVVQNVEEFTPKSEARPLGQTKSPLLSDIGLSSVEGTQHVAPEISLQPGSRLREGQLVESLTAWESRAEQLQGYSWIQVGPGL